MTYFSSFLLACIGFLLVALTQKRPRELLVKGDPITNLQVIVYRMSSSLSLGASFFLSVAYDGWSLGIIFWGTMISLSGIFVSFSITTAGAYRKKKHDMRFEIVDKSTTYSTPLICKILETSCHQ